MAENSIREAILASLEDAMRKVALAKTITRTWPSFAAMENFSETEFPVIAVVGGLPDPAEYKRSARRKAGVEWFRSVLKVSIFLYDRSTTAKCDTRLSDLADEVWKKFWLEPTFGGYVEECSASFPELPETIDPYIASRMSVSLKYLHTTGGI